jgi:NADH:ubiquinone reductase (H+-translocating)
MTSKKRIVLVGGGFAGLNFLKGIANDDRFEVVLVDKNNYHYFPPLLYQVGMAFIELSNITYPFRRFLQKKRNIRFHYGSLVAVQPETNSIETDNGWLSYDHLILAHGTETNYFGMEKVRLHSLPLKTINDALNIRNHLLLNVEKAARTNDLKVKQRLLTVVIAGGGPTGVEIAGMMAEMVPTLGRKEYPEFTRGSFQIYLVQSDPVLLGTMSTKAQTEALEVLQRLGVKVLLNTRVKDYIDCEVVLNDGQVIPSNALLWTSGVIAREVKGLRISAFGPGRRVIVDASNKVKSYENIFALGDISLDTSDSRFPKGHPQLAQVAIQQGKLLASNLKRVADGLECKPFGYDDKGAMAIISKYKAVADLPNTSIKGFVAWLAWLFIHLVPIAGFRNKLDLIFNWAWAFITNDPTLRLIIRREVNELQREKNLIAPEPSPHDFKFPAPDVKVKTATRAENLNR